MSARSLALRDRLSERDLEILILLRQQRLMTGQQIRRVFFPEGNKITQARKTRAALARLSNHRLIVRFARRVGGLHAGSEGQIIGLRGLGYSVLAVGATAPVRHRRVPETTLAHQSHVLAISELYVHLVEHDRASRCELLEYASEPECWRRFAGIGGQTIILKPDAFTRIGLGEYEQVAFIEQDMATESLPTIVRKLGVYIDYWRSGQEQQANGVFPRIWWLVPHEGRREAIASVIRQVPAEARSLFAVVLTDQATDHLTLAPEQLEGGEQ